MESKTYAFWTGLFTLGLLIVLAIIIGWMGNKGQKETVSYTFVAKQSVTGLNKEAPVLLRGIPVGRITDLSIDPGDRQLVLVSAEIDESVPLTTAMYGKLKPQGITGLMFVELFEEGRGRRLLPQAQRIPMRPSDLQQFSEAITDIVEQLKQVSTNLNGIMNTENQQHLKHMIGELDNASTELTPLLQETRLAVGQSRTFMSSLQKSAVGVDKSFTNMSKDFHVTAGNVDQTAKKLASTLDKVDGTMAALSSTAVQLDTTVMPGAITLIDQLSRTAYTLDDLLRAQQRQPNRLIFGQKTEEPGPGEAGFKAGGVHHD